jgi:hypothetical protein
VRPSSTTAGLTGGSQASTWWHVAVCSSGGGGMVCCGLGLVRPGYATAHTLPATIREHEPEPEPHCAAQEGGMWLPCASMRPPLVVKPPSRTWARGGLPRPLPPTPLLYCSEC